MRITYIHQHYRSPQQAGGTRSWEFARRLAAEGHSVTIVSGANSASQYSESGFRVVQHRAAYSNTLGMHGRIRSFISFMAKATITALRTPADVIYASSTPLTVALPAIIASKIRRIPYVFEVRDLWPEVPIELGYLTNPVLIRLARWLELAAYRGANEVVALSPSMAAGVRRVAPNAQVSIVPNSADIDAFNKSAPERERIRNRLGWSDHLSIVYAGSLGAIYDTSWMIKLACALHNAPIHITVIGEGRELVELRRQIEGFQLHNITLTGPMPKETVAEYLSAADLAISTLIDASTLAGSSLNKVFDALAAGRPVLFNHGGWLSDLLVANGAGWQLNRDPAVAANQLEQIRITSSELPAAQQATRNLAQMFSRDRHYASIHRILQSTMKNHTPAVGH